MRFALHYSGPLHSDGKPPHKHEVRQAFHPQLAKLWEPKDPNNPDNKGVLEPWRSFLLPPTHQNRKLGEVISSVRPRGDFTFIPLVTKELKLVASLEVVLFRPEPPGLLVGGDIDNRIKTLFDALAMPRDVGSLLPPRGDENPHFFVLLEDDHLVTSLTIRAERLLKPVADDHVELFIDVNVTATAAIIGNVAFR